MGLPILTCDLHQEISIAFLSPKISTSDEERYQGLPFPYFIPVAIIRLAQALDELRVRLDNQPLILSSGYRSPFYYKQQPNKVSTHRFGTAVDIIQAENVKAPSEALLNIVYSKAFDGEVTPGERPSGKSSLGFNYAESLSEMDNKPDHAHLDMGYISGFADEINHLNDLVIHQTH